MQYLGFFLIFVALIAGVVGLMQHLKMKKILAAPFKKTGEIDWKVAGASYLGVGLVGAGYLSLGLLMSAVTKSQFLALVMTALVILSLFILGIGEFVAREGTTLHELCSYVSIWAQMNDFANGIIDSRRLVFDGSLTIGTLFAFIGYLANFFDPVQQLSQLYNTFIAAVAALDKIVDLLEEEPEVADAPDARALPPVEKWNPTHCGEAGFEIVYTPHAVLYHHESVTKTVIAHPSEIGYLRERWARVIAHDPYYNPNLTRQGEDARLNMEAPVGH